MNLFIVDDKIQSIKRCDLPSVIITVRGCCLIGEGKYNLDCLTGVIPMWVFLVCCGIVRLFRNKPTGCRPGK